jgi:thiol-disulfide isomerase/thioredoxin
MRIFGSLIAVPLGLALAACAHGPDDAATANSEPGEAETRALPRVEPASGEDILRAVRAPGAEAVLVNVWATWCVPCREEFPALVRMHREYGGKGLRLILVSADFGSEMPEVLKFLAEHGVDFRTYIKTGKDMEFIDSLHEDWTGALPATFIFDAGGRLTHFWQEKATYATFEQRVLEVLNERARRRG